MVAVVITGQLSFSRPFHVHHQRLFTFIISPSPTVPTPSLPPTASHTTHTHTTLCSSAAPACLAGTLTIPPPEFARRWGPFAARAPLLLDGLVGGPLVGAVGGARGSVMALGLGDAAGPGQEGGPRGWGAAAVEDEPEPRGDAGLVCRWRWWWWWWRRRWVGWQVRGDGECCEEGGRGCHLYGEADVFFHRLSSFVAS